MDLERPLEEQGRIDVFLHKLTDVIAAADQGNLKVMNNKLVIIHFILRTVLVCILISYLVYILFNDGVENNYVYIIHFLFWRLRKCLVKCDLLNNN